MELEHVMVEDILAVKTFQHGVLPDVEATAPPRATETKRRLEADSDGCPESRAKLYRCAAVDKSLGRPCPAGELPLPQLQSKEAPGPSVVATQPGGHQPAPRSDLSAGPVPRCSGSLHVGGKMLRDKRQQHVGSLEELHVQQSVLQAQLHSQISVRLEEIKELQVQQTIVQGQRLEVEKRQQQGEHLKKQLKDALQQQRKVIEELKSSRQCFEEILQAKDKELERTKKAKEQAWAQKDEVVIQMTDILENELQCIICSELLIEGVTLSCAHSFCQYCIGEWRKRSGTCPICQQDILSQTRSLVLDNCIERMVESLRTELKEHRLALLVERKAAVAVVLISDEDTSDSSYSSDSILDVIDVVNTIH